MTDTTAGSEAAAWLVWSAVLGGFVAWAVRFAIGYLLVPTACAVGTWTTPSR